MYLVSDTKRKITHIGVDDVLEVRNDDSLMYKSVFEFLNVR